jgi:hypothetical protein
VIVPPKYAGENLVFIVGCSRSGTTWVQRLLSCHPQVRTGQESNLFSDFIGFPLRKWRRGLSLRERGGVGMACYFTECEIFELLHNFMRTLLQRMLEPLSAGQFFVDKTPGHALYLPEIAEFLPASRVIHVIRDPRDVVASLLAASRTWAKESAWAPDRAHDAAAVWVRTVNSVRNFRKRAKPGQFLELRYEALHHSPLQALQEVRDFIGLAWPEEEMRTALESNRMIGPSGSLLSQPIIPLAGQAALVSGPEVIDPAGFLRKGVPGSWKSDLSLGEKLSVWRVTRLSARKNGYQIGLLR